MSDIIIRDATPEDAHAIAVMHRQSWLDTYSSFVDTSFMEKQSIEELAQGWHNHISNLKAKQVFLVAEQNGEIIGITYAGKARGETTIGEIYLMYIAREYTGKGLGTRLWQQATDFLSKVDLTSFYVTALRGNDSGNAFYSRKGGVRTDDEDFVTPTGQVLPQYRYTFHKESPDA